MMQERWSYGFFVALIFNDHPIEHTAKVFVPSALEEPTLEHAMARFLVGFPIARYQDLLDARAILASRYPTETCTDMDAIIDFTVRNLTSKGTVLFATVPEDYRAAAQKEADIRTAERRIRDMIKNFDFTTKERA